MSHLTGIARRVIAYGLYYTGVLWLIAVLRLRRKAVVLMYHRVLPHEADTVSHEGIIVSPETFGMHIAFLARHFRPLTVPQFIQSLTDSDFADRSCLVTFDDGWQDNHEHALPILKKHRVPAVFFVATKFVGSTVTFWQERLTRLLALAATRHDVCNDLLAEVGIEPQDRLNFGTARRRARQFVTSLKASRPDIPPGLIKRLESVLLDEPCSRDLGVDRFMTWEQVTDLVESGVATIGSHSHSHDRLTLLGYAAAKADLERSRDELVRMGVPHPLSCAYPNGDVNDPVEAAATDAGFLLGFGTKPGYVSHSSEAMHLRRINIHETATRTPAEFLYRLLGLP